MNPPLLLSVFPSFAVGGAQMRFTTLANQFGQAWRHAIVAMDGDISARERLDSGLRVEFPAVDVRKGDTLGNMRRFRAALRALQPDTLLTHNFGSIEWALSNRWPGRRHVHVEDGFGPEERDRQLPRRVWLRRVALRGRTAVLPSQTLMRIARDQWRLPARDLHYVPNGVDVQRFGRGAGGGGLVVGTVAALRAEKNIGRLIRAFALAAPAGPARLRIIGDGPEREALRAVAAAAGVAERVELLGHVPAPAAMLGELDVFALSSDTEQMPLSLLEAMASGLPVAATDVGDVGAMLPRAQQPFVTRRDDAALSAALAALLRDGALRAELGAANRARVEAEFSQARMVERWDALLQGRTSLP